MSKPAATPATHVTARTSFTASVLLSFCALACSANNESAPFVGEGWRSERTVSGDTTIVRTIGAAAPGAELRLVRESTTGRSDGTKDELLSNVQYVTPLPDNGIALVDASGDGIARFDSSGRFLNLIARKGDGPGEFRSVGRMLVVDDSTLAVSGSGRLAVLGFDGALRASRMIRFTDEPIVSGVLAAAVDSLLHVSRLVFDPRHTDSVTATGFGVTTTAVLVLPPEGDAIDTLLQPDLGPSRHTYTYNHSGFGRTEVRNVPLSVVPTAVYSPLGYWITGGRSDSYSFTLHRRDGAVHVESDLPPVEASDEERAYYLYAITRAARTADPDASFPNDLIPRYKKPYQSLSTDADGRVWVQLSQPGVREPVDTMPASGALRLTSAVMTRDADGNMKVFRPLDPGMPKQTERWIEPPVYDVFAPTGYFLGRIRIPDGATFMASSGEHVWLVEKDALDVPFVVRYRVMSSADERVAPGWR